MKLLIVDDEVLTREGLFENIDWKALGITEVFQADDGIRGMAVMEKYQPEIVLTDVRMPRMNGIGMAEQIQELYPETNVIFMSGFSDKEYLKAAIKLKVIRYVEKPIDTLEVEEAVREATANIEAQKRTKYSELRRHQEEKAKLALALTYEYALEKGEVQKALKLIQSEIDEETTFYTIIVKFLDPILEQHEKDIKEIVKQFCEIVHNQKRNILYGFKGYSYLILHIYHDKESSRRQDMYLNEYLKENLSPFGACFIAQGKAVRGIDQVFQSYNSAVILLQSSFFNEHNTILTEGEVNVTASVLENRLDEWKQLLKERSQDGCGQLIEHIFTELRDSQNLLPSQVKDIYYKYFMQIENALNQNYAIASAQLKEADTIWGKIEQCKTLRELNDLLIEQTRQFFVNDAVDTDDNPVIRQIKDFIRKNCTVETLSVKDVGEHVYLTTSYVCTVFKNETGQTLNQYITECRLERAKEMLQDPRYKISDISAAVGYGDGNYFGKTFKKNVGLSPSEYREKMLG